MAYIYNLTDTWNAGGTTFYGIHLNVTNTASASGSRLLSLQVSGSEVFGVAAAGHTYIAGNLWVNASKLLIQHDGTNVYIRNTVTGGQVFLGANNTNTLWIGSNFLAPNIDNTIALGGSGNRFTTVYATTGTINTSDEREKAWRGSLSSAEMTAARRIANELGFYQWNDAITEKGQDGARWHFGVRAQAVARILIEEGIEDDQPINFAPNEHVAEPPSFRTAFLCFDTWEATPQRLAGNRFGLRVDQLILFLIAAQEVRLAALESR